jgi:hypothetical protein
MLGLLPHSDGRQRSEQSTAIPSPRKVYRCPLAVTLRVNNRLPWWGSSALDTSSTLATQCMYVHASGSSLRWERPSHNLLLLGSKHATGCVYAPAVWGPHRSQYDWKWSVGSSERIQLQHEQGGGPRLEAGPYYHSIPRLKAKPRLLARDACTVQHRGANPLAAQSISNDLTVIVSM